MNADKGKGRYLTIDGVDGVGKTTVCKEIQQLTGWEVLESPVEPFACRDTRERIDREDDPVLRAWFYRAAVQMDARRINESKDEGRNIVTDRSPLSTWICTWEEVEELKQHEEVFWGGLPRPDLKVVLTATPMVRKQRLEERRKVRPGEGPREDGRRIEDDRERQERWQARMVEWGKSNGAEVIDTDRSEAAMIAGEIVRKTGWQL